MHITRRSVLILPVALAIGTSAMKERYPCLSCFLPDEIPVSLPAGQPATYDTYSTMPAFVAVDAYSIAMVRWSKPTAAPLTISDDQLEKLAATMLHVASQETEFDGMHFDTFEGKSPRIVALPDGGRVSVGDPEYLGRLSLYPSGQRGLVLHNPSAVVRIS